MATLTFHPSAYSGSWTNPTYGYANDTKYATAAPARNGSTVVQYSGFNIDSSIPTGSKINSVTFYTNWKVSASNYAYDTLTAQIYVNGTAKSPSISTTSLSTTFTTNSAIVTGLTLANLANSIFKVYVTAARGSSYTSYTAYLNYVYVVVDYTLPSIGVIETPTISSVTTSMESNISYSAIRNINLKTFVSIPTSTTAAYQHVKAEQITLIKPGHLIADININAPFIPWSAHKAVPAANTIISFVSGIKIKIYRMPPTMTATVRMNPCKDPHPGSIDNPYLITTLADLQAIPLTNTNGSWYALANDIDSAGATINPISDMSANLDGRGHTIKNLTIQQNSNSSYVGLFDILWGSNQNFRNINFDNISIIRLPSSSYTIDYAGILAGTAGQSSYNLSVSNIHVTNCSFASDLSQNTSVGGIFGYLSAQINMAECSVESTVLTGGIIGGLIGVYGSSSGTIQSCYTSGTINGNSNYSITCAGGLIGNFMSSSNNIVINNCYSKMFLWSTTSYNFKYMGGLIGNAYGNIKIINSFYAGYCYGYNVTPRGLVGSDFTLSMTVVNSYVDYTAMGISSSYIACGTPLTTDAMKQAGTYGYWDFPWVIDAAYNDGYPSFNFNTTKPFLSTPMTTTGNLQTDQLILKSLIKQEEIMDLTQGFPEGTICSNYGIIADPAGMDGFAIANTGHLITDLYSLAIPIIMDNDGIIQVEYYMSCWINYGQIFLDGAKIFENMGYETKIGSATPISKYGNVEVGEKWATYEIPLLAGSHTIKFIFYKYNSGDYGSKDIFAVRKIFKMYYKNYFSNGFNLISLFPRYGHIGCIGGGEIIEKKPQIVKTYLRPRLPVAETFNGAVIDFSSGGLPSGSSLEYFIIEPDPTGNGKGEVLTSTNGGIASSTGSVAIPITLTETMDISIDYYFSTENSCDWLFILLDGYTKLKTSGNTSSYTSVNGDPITNPNTDIFPNTWQTYTIKNVAAGSHTISFWYEKDNSVNNGLDLVAISRIAYESNVTLYNAIYNGIVPKIEINPVEFENGVACNISKNLITTPLVSNIYDKNHFIKLDYKLKSQTASNIKADMYYNDLDYFRIVSTLLAVMGDDKESIMIKW